MRLHTHRVQRACSPADVVYGDVPELLIHGRLALPAGVGAEGRLGVFVGHMDLYLSAPFERGSRGE